MAVATALPFASDEMLRAGAEELEMGVGLAELNGPGSGLALKAFFFFITLCTAPRPIPLEKN